MAHGAEGSCILILYIVYDIHAPTWFWNSTIAVLSALQTPLEQPHFTSVEIALQGGAPSES
jgi:hypothetical protein